MKNAILVLAVISLTGISTTAFSACPSADLTGDCVVDANDFAIMASQWLSELAPDPNGMVWVYVDDPGVAGHEGFTGYMSKYETTNAQYCEFLNAALASNDITVSGNDAIGANGSNSGVDHVGELYYNGAGAGLSVDDASAGGMARIDYSGGVFSVDSGFEDHPVPHVTWYGAMAFANYYSCRLPTEWEWQATADFDGSFAYGCGISINNSIANYLGSAHPNGTTIVGSFGAYGYEMCDMAGNLWEWTDSYTCYYPICEPELNYRVVCGGRWDGTASGCAISSKYSRSPDYAMWHLGFRVCR